MKYFANQSVLVACLLAFLLVVLAASVNPPTSEEGQKYYLKKCKICHGKDGDKQLGDAPKLSTSTMPMDSVVLRIQEGKGSMPAFNKKLTPDQQKAVGEYVVGLRKE